MAVLRKSHITQAIKRPEKESTQVFQKTMSPYVRFDNEIMEGFLARLERYYMNCYNSVSIVEDLYNYTKEK